MFFAFLDRKKERGKTGYDQLLLLNAGITEIPATIFMFLLNFHWRINTYNRLNLSKYLKSVIISVELKGFK